MRIKDTLTASVVLGLTSLPAIAHPGHAEQGLTAGLLHPMAGPDHLLAAIAVGVLATQISGRAVWALPAAFLIGMTVGSALSLLGVALPGVEWGIALSLLAIGVAIATRAAGPLAVTSIAVGLLAVFHGHAHFSEYTAPAGLASYAVGLFVATALLHAVGVAFASTFKRQGKLELVRVIGAIVLTFGLLKIAGVA